MRNINFSILCSADYTITSNHRHSRGIRDRHDIAVMFLKGNLLLLQARSSKSSLYLASRRNMRKRTHLGAVAQFLPLIQYG